MTSCDLCGKPATTTARIEGVAMRVCAACAAYGTELTPPRRAGNAPIGAAHDARPQGLRAHETEFVLVGDFGYRLRQARQRLKLTEEEAALRLRIQKNALLHYESGKLQPDEDTTKRLERFYGVSLRLSL